MPQENVQQGPSTVIFSRLAQLLRITIKSVGCFDPPYKGEKCDETVGSVIVNGVEMSLNKAGFNFVIIDFKTGKPEHQESFDTHGEAGASDKMVAFMDELKPWKIIAISVRKDAKNYLPDSALEAFVRNFLPQILILIK